jgi:glucose/arabinose dehydrogenase
LCPVLLALFSFHTFAATYKLESVASGLVFPSCVTQAPGDSNAIYIVENVVTNSPNNKLGRILRRDLIAQTNSVFLDLSAMPGANNNNGLHQLEFHPGYTTNGKFYITYQFRAASSGLITARLDEYRVTNGTPTFQRMLLQHQINTSGAHAIDRPFFRPGGDPNHLYITAGDGGPEANSSGYTTNRAQNLGFTYGKLLRVDVTDGLDAYPADTNKNFGIPAINISATNPPGRLGEVIASGFRNPWRACFDPLTGDLYIGDNGFHTCEEVDFLKADLIYPVSVVIPDYGWPATEGIFNPVPSANAFVQSQPTNTGSIYPIIARTAANLDPGVDITGDGIPDAHGDGDDSVIGGCLYRGPIAEFYGKYIYGDYVAGHVYACDFDRDTSPALFNGHNVSNFTDITTNLEATLPGADINSPTGFYADAAGDLYLVKYGTSAAGSGEIFKLVAVPLTPVLASPEYADGQFSVVVNGATGESYAVEVSTNLIDWTGLATNAAPFTNFEPISPEASYRFYRARHQPQ